MTRDKLKLPIFYITTSLFWFSLYAYVPIFPGYVESSGVSYSLIGVILGFYGLSQMLVRIPLGMISDRINKRKPFITLGLFFGLASSVGLWFFHNAGMLLLFRSLAGVAAASWVAFSVLFSSYFRSEEAPKAVGYLTSANTFDQILAMFLGGSLAGKLGDRITFLLAAIAGVLGLFISFFVIENKNMNRKPLTVFQLVSVGKSGNLLVLSILAIFAQFIMFGTIYGFTPLFAKVLGANSYQLGLLTTLSALSGILAGSLSGSFFIKRFGEKKTLFIGIVLPLLMGLCIKNIDESKRGSAMGFFQAIYGLGMFGGPAVVGFLSDVASLNIGFFVTAFVGVLALLGVAFFIKGSSKYNLQ